MKAAETEAEPVALQARLAGAAKGREQAGRREATAGEATG